MGLRIKSFSEEDNEQVMVCHNLRAGDSLYCPLSSGGEAVIIEVDPPTELPIPSYKDDGCAENLPRLQRDGIDGNAYYPHVQPINISPLINSNEVHGTQNEPVDLSIKPRGPSVHDIKNNQNSPV